MSEEPHGAKKIIIDEDWKSQIEEERRRADAGQAGPQPAAPAEPQLPPPSLLYLAGTLYLQGAIGLGLLPNPVSGKAEFHLAQAKHAIDTLQILQEKTEGNRTAEESEEIEAMLYQLRMAFVELNQHRQEGGGVKDEG
jgi:hypothetical protein